MLVIRGSMNGLLALEAAAGSGAPPPRGLARSKTYARKLRPLPAGQDTAHAQHSFKDVAFVVT